MESLFTKYGDLIRNLPIDEHSFTSKKENWKNLTDNIIKYHENIFSFDSTITISRKEIFDSFKDDPIEKFILKVLYWAYPRGLRGNNFEEIIEPGNFELLKDFLEDIKSDNTINEEKIKYALKNIKGINFSTLSKYLYFTRSNFEGKHCLIIDKRLISVFNKMYFVEYNSLRKISYPCTVTQYFDYIDISHRIAGESKFSADQLEMFLFIFGNNLKLDPVGDNGEWDESWDFEDDNQYEAKELRGLNRVRVLEIWFKDIRNYIDKKLSFILPYSYYNVIEKSLFDSWEKYSDISGPLIRKEIAEGLRKKKMLISKKKFDEFMCLLMEALYALYGLKDEEIE